MTHILVTGGAGYIGAHVVTELLAQGYEVSIIDDFSTGIRSRIESLNVTLIEGDVGDRLSLDEALKNVDVVIHLAACKSVEESMINPMKYWVNVSNTILLLRACESHNVKRVLFSSTAAVYSPEDSLKIHEENVLNPISIYGMTKLYCEKAITDWASLPSRSYFIFRYFNVGGSAAKKLQDNSKENLIPKVISRVRENLSCEIYGDDYETFDGTCVRDYIHVSDIAEAHVSAVEKILENQVKEVINLGSGEGYSVREILMSIEKSLGIQLSKVISPKRAGDVASLVASNEKAERILSWKPKRTIHEIVRSSI